MFLSARELAYDDFNQLIAPTGEECPEISRNSFFYPFPFSMYHPYRESGFMDKKRCGIGEDVSYPLKQGKSPYLVLFKAPCTSFSEKMLKADAIECYMIIQGGAPHASKFFIESFRPLPGFFVVLVASLVFHPTTIPKRWLKLF
ncbi:MAG TPA: hypothetical protein VMT81_01280 [Candidatus Paceibacterota bacterium]|nr:hypothetical protein [Candidatus Paceibacterota bacterium]